MSQRLGDIVAFRGDRLFNGAVNLDWFGTDDARSRAASAAFVFHGPRYHGVHQEDVGTGHQHNLMDTATLARNVVRQCYGSEDPPFTLAIAGYGTGKSHLALTLARLLSDPLGEGAEPILSALTSVDEAIGREVRALLEEAGQPCLVLALNGMQNLDLTAEITRQIVRDLKARGLDPKPLDELRPRFAQAATLIRMSNAEVVQELVTVCDADGVQDILNGLGQQEESTYAKVHDFFASRGMTIRALAGESLSDVIKVAVREYCGRGRPYRSLVVLFDEFGRYTEFATYRSQIAGSGALQDLFEAIQAHEGSACFVGFIQFELNAYVQRIAPEYRNEILRYVARYQTAKRIYLSINLETLIASLLEKRRPQALDDRFDSVQAHRESQEIMETLARWFPEACNHRLWRDLNQFHTVIRKGCWPLSAFSTWFLFYLASAGKHLQERSALALLGDAFARQEETDVPDRRAWDLAPTDLWSDALQQELLSSEESGQQGSVAHAFASVTARHGARLTSDGLQFLRAVVLASKLGLQSTDRDDATKALAELAGITLGAAEAAVRLLSDEYNVLEWDEAFKEFGILGDAVPRTQFLSFVRQRVASSYDEAGKARLFASKAGGWCDLLGDLECDFAERHRIATREWRFQSVTANLDQLAPHITLAADQWRESLGVDEPRGTIIYCYVEPSRDVALVASDAAKLLRMAAREAGVPLIPMAVVLVCDADGALGQALAEFAVLEESVSSEDKVRFGNLIVAHQDKLRQVIRDLIERRIRERRYVTGLKEALESRRLSDAGTELFNKAYESPIQFPFDGFSTAKGNAADTCQELTAELLTGRLIFDSVIAKPVKAKNRALTVLKDTWGVFSTKGDVSRRPSHPVLRSIMQKWDDLLATGEQRLQVEGAVRQVCLPPHGANIASAGLLLGVFVAPRAGKLVVLRNGEQLAVTQWVQDGLFRGKFIDLASLHGVDLVSIGEASSEWKTLLDEWEQADSHLARRDCLQRATALRNRIPIPPADAYREMHLREQAGGAISALASMDHDQGEAIDKTEQGIQRLDVSLLSWGAADLKKLIDQMRAARPLWTDSQIEEVQPHYERARQAVIQLVPEWLRQQTPLSDSPQHVGNFCHKMLHLVGGSLKSLGLDVQRQQLETHTQQVVKRAETITDAHQLVRDVESLTARRDPVGDPRVSDLRAMRNAAKEYAAKLQEMSKRIALAEIEAARRQLSTFEATLQAAEKEVMNRATQLCQAKVRSEDDIERLQAEVEKLLHAFANVPNDEKYFLLMQRALRRFRAVYQELTDNRLTWPEFENLADRCRQDAIATFGDSELPWTPSDTIAAFVETVSKQRRDVSAEWISSLEADAVGIASMAAADANRLHVRASNPPSVLTAPDTARLTKTLDDIGTRLDALKIDWLLEKFRELPPQLRKRFLGLAASED